MKKAMLATLMAVVGLSTSVQANESKLRDGYYTMDAMGCMILMECTDGVTEINNMLDIANVYPNSNFIPVTTEFNYILTHLSDVGVKVFLADQKYFPPGHRGVYHTVSNNFYLNKAFMHRPNVLMTVMRHEGWHAAQDCMAGTIKNSLIAIIKPEEDVPQVWRDIVEKTYPKSAVPWEAEAKWAGMTQGMTAKALAACASGNMWEVYKPTPLTEKWLRENKYIK